MPSTFIQFTNGVLLQALQCQTGGEDVHSWNAQVYTKILDYVEGIKSDHVKVFREVWLVPFTARRALLYSSF